MKKQKIKAKVKELKLLVLALNAYGSVNLDACQTLNRHINALFKRKRRR